MKIKKEYIQFVKYGFVGGISFVVDYSLFTVVLFLLGVNTVNIVIATTVGFIFGLTTNFLIARKFVFTEAKVSVKNEFLIYGIIGAIGYVLQVVLILAFVSLEPIIPIFNPQISKIFVTFIVLIYNFLARKKILY